MLLSRVAANLYWAARYLERAEGTARIVREHTSLLIDMPPAVMSSWEPLLAITGTNHDYNARHEHIDEAGVVAYLLAEEANPSSIRSSVDQARQNLRTCREVIPGPAWVTVNGLKLYVDQHAVEGVNRRSRSRFLDRVIHDHQHLIGVLITTMSHDHAYTLLRLGRHIERADMATRVLDVWATNLLADPTEDLHRYSHLQWSSLLQALSALQMYQRSPAAEPGPTGPARFILDEVSFPRSVRYCLTSAAAGIAQLPRSEPVVAEIAAALAVLDGIQTDTLDADRLHRGVDDLQLAIAAVNGRIGDAYFAVSGAPSSA